MQFPFLFQEIVRKITWSFRRIYQISTNVAPILTVSFIFQPNFDQIPNLFSNFLEKYLEDVGKMLKPTSFPEYRHHFAGIGEFRTSYFSKFIPTNTNICHSCKELMHTAFCLCSSDLNIHGRPLCGWTHDMQNNNWTTKCRIKCDSNLIIIPIWASTPLLLF